LLFSVSVVGPALGMHATPLCFANTFYQSVILPSWQTGDVSSQRIEVQIPQVELADLCFYLRPKGSHRGLAV
jgi:hypothetical protein